MKIILKPKTEQEIAKATRPDSDPKEVKESLKVRADACVNHLCGCNCGC